MSFIYNNKKNEVIDFDPDCPIFVDGMNCANFQGQEFTFREVDVTRMTDLSYFFNNCTYLTKTPIIRGYKESYDGMFIGCISLTEVRLIPTANNIVRLYTEPMYANMLAINILNLSEQGLFLNFNIEEIGEQTRVLYVPNETYTKMENLYFYKNNGIWELTNNAEQSEIRFKDYLNSKGWIFTGA